MTLGLVNMLAWVLAAPLRRPTALFTSSLFLVAAAIAANALFLQSRQHPAPLVATRGVSEPEAQAAPRAPEQRRADDLVLAVQRALRRVGYYTGPLDGLAGPQTKAAILAFETAAARAQTGEASLDLLTAVRAAKASDASSLADIAAGDNEDGEPAPDPRIAAVQHALSISAYGPVHEDGFLGAQTREAILRFQRDHGLPPTGEISDALMVELRAAGALQGQ